MVCQHNGEQLSEKPERYEVDEASDSGESKESSFRVSRTHLRKNDSLWIEKSCQTNRFVLKKSDVSSTNWKQFKIHLTTHTKRSDFTVLQNKSGPWMKPWGIPKDRPHTQMQYTGWLFKSQSNLYLVSHPPWIILEMDYYKMDGYIVSLILLFYWYCIFSLVNYLKFWSQYQCFPQ